VRDRPERVALLPPKIAVVALELRRVLDVGSTDHVLAHGLSSLHIEAGDLNRRPAAGTAHGEAETIFESSFCVKGLTEGGLRQKYLARHSGPRTRSKTQR